MYADRYAGPGRFNAGGLAAAVGVNAAFVAALIFAAPDWIPKLPDKPFGGVVVELDPPPPEPAPPPPKAMPQTSAPPSVPDAPRPEVRTPIDMTGITTDLVAPPIPGEITGTPAGTGEGVAIDPPAPPAPMLVGPAVDPRYARDLQPPYPSSEQREGNDGRVTVRVRVGADGRVREVRRVSATSDAFFRATEEQARRRWRFRPATRDGVAEEGWRTMTVTFVLAD